MSTWVDNMLEPEPEDGETGMTIIPPAPQEAVGVMPPPAEPVAPVAPPAEEKKITWRDFTLEEHVRAFLEVPYGSKLKLGKAGVKNKYRATVFTPVGSGVVVDNKITNSAYLDITVGPDGYIIVNETVGEFKMAEEPKKKKW